MLRLASDETRGPYSDQERQSAIAKLQRFMRRDEFRDHFRRTHERLWDGVHDVDSERVAQLMETGAALQTAVPYFLYDAGTETGETLTELFLKRHSASLSRGERAYLDRASVSHCRLYEITEVRANEGIAVHDLFTGEDSFVHERAATTQLSTWQIIAARVMESPLGALMFDSIGAVFPPSLKDRLVAVLAAARRTALSHGMSLDETKFFKELVPLVHAVWVREVAAAPAPRLSTTDGDDLAFVKVVFDVYDEASVIAAFDAAEHLVAEGGGRYVWLDDDDSRVLGTFFVTAKRLTYEGLSESRAQRAREFVEMLAGPAVLFRLNSARSAEDLRQRRTSDDPAPSPPQVPGGAEVISAFYEEHYRQWVDQPIPMLGGRTPRHAAKLKTVRPVLISLIKDIESASERQRRGGAPAPDVSWMWKELGLDRDERTAPVVDARPPIERLESMIRAKSHARRGKLFDDIRAEIVATADAERWVRATTTLEQRGTLSSDVATYLISMFLESMTSRDMDEDPELVRLQDALEAIERAQGLREGEFWFHGEGPAEWHALNAQWEARDDALVAGRLRDYGRADLAGLFEKDQDDFLDIGERGRVALFGRGRGSGRR